MEIAASATLAKKYYETKNGGDIEDLDLQTSTTTTSTHDYDNDDERVRRTLRWLASDLATNGGSRGA